MILMMWRRHGMLSKAHALLSGAFPGRKNVNGLTIKIHDPTLNHCLAYIKVYSLLWNISCINKFQGSRSPKLWACPPLSKLWNAQASWLFCLFKTFTYENIFSGVLHRNYWFRLALVILISTLYCVLDNDTHMCEIGRAMTDWNS